jgi:hypothetical protein
MLTLTETPESTFVAWIYENRKRKKKIWYHPFRDVKLRNSVDNLESFNTETFRDRFRITRPQATSIIDHLTNKTEPDEKHLHNKFFKIKKHIEESLYSEMDLSDIPNQKIMIDFPDSGWACTELVASGSSAGKTWYLKEKVLRNLLGPAKFRRNFLWISNEFEIDKTLSILKKPKFQKYFTGVDISDASVDNAFDSQSADEFFQKNVKNAVLNLEPGSVCIVDDAQDSPIYKQMFKMINKLLRTGRHNSIGLCYILHKIKSGLYSTQASSSCRFYTIFPKLAKGKVLDFLLDQGVSKREAVRHLEDFSHARSRQMTVRLHAPTCLISEEFIRLF